jgi:hypothetical protein
MRVYARRISITRHNPSAAEFMLYIKKERKGRAKKKTSSCDDDLYSQFFFFCVLLRLNKITITKHQKFIVLIKKRKLIKSQSSMTKEKEE